MSAGRRETRKPDPGDRSGRRPRPPHRPAGGIIAWWRGLSAALQVTLVAGLTTAAATVLAAIIAGVFALVNSSAESPAPRRGSAAATDLVEARITHTYDKQRQAYIGTLKYPSPNSSVGRTNGPADGATVFVVCQTKGRTISSDADPQLPNWPASSDVWDRISLSGEIWYIPDIYTDLPKDRLPAVGLAAC